MEAEHTDLKTLNWDTDDDGAYLGGRLKESGTTVIVAMHLAEIDARNIVQACNAHEADQKKIADLRDACERLNQGGGCDCSSYVKPDVCQFCEASEAIANAK